MDSLKALVLTFVSSLYTRFEIVATEIEEERERLEEMLLIGIAAVFALSVGVLLVSLFIVAVFWDTSYRLLVLGLVTLAYLGTGVGLGLLLRHKVRNKPRLFATTLAELAKDRDTLRAGSAPREN